VWRYVSYAVPMIKKASVEILGDRLGRGGVIHKCGSLRAAELWAWRSTEAAKRFPQFGVSVYWIRYGNSVFLAEASLDVAQRSN